jgi:hypothetical protein
MAKYKVIAKITRRFMIEVEAESSYEAIHDAETASSDKWIEDYDCGGFNITSAERVSEEDEDEE